MMTVVYKIALEIWGTPPLKKIGGPKISQFLRNFGQLCNLFAHLRIGTRHHQSENSVAIYEHSCTCLLNLVNVGPQTVKNSTIDWANPK